MLLEIYTPTGFGGGRVRSSTLTGIMSYYAITAVVRSTAIVKIQVFQRIFRLKPERQRVIDFFYQ